MISLNGVGDTGSRPDPWSMVGLDGRQAPLACPLLFCMGAVSGLGPGQWPEGSAVASRPASDPHLRQSTRLG